MEYNIFLSRWREEEEEKNLVCKEYYLSHHAIKVCGLILGLFHQLQWYYTFLNLPQLPIKWCFWHKGIFKHSLLSFCVRCRASECECVLRHSRYPTSLTSGVVRWGQRQWMLNSLSHGYFNLHWQLLSDSIKIYYINIMNQRLTTGRKQVSLHACR